MKSDEEIKAEVVDYWNHLVGRVKKQFEDSIKRLASIYGLKITSGIPSIGSIDGSQLYDYFDSDNESLTQGFAEVYLSDYLSLEDKYVDIFAICETLNCEYLDAKKFVVDIFEGRPKDYEKFINENQVYFFLIKLRNKVVEIHKEQKKMLPKLVSELKNHYKGLVRHRPESSKEVLQGAIDRMSYLIKFSDEIIRYLEHDWPTSIGLDPNLNKDFTKQSFWNPIILRCYNMLAQNYGHSHYRSCNLTAQLLGILFPSIWSGDLKKITSRIRKRIDDMNPHLVPSR
jgi:hypothetical protein